MIPLTDTFLSGLMRVNGPFSTSFCKVLVIPRKRVLTVCLVYCGEIVFDAEESKPLRRDVTMP